MSDTAGTAHFSRQEIGAMRRLILERARCRLCRARVVFEWKTVQDTSHMGLPIQHPPLEDIAARLRHIESLRLP